MRWLPLFILALFIYLEVALFVKVAEIMGVFLALVLVLLTSLLGASLVRSRGMANLYVLREKLQKGEDPASEIVRNVTLLLAGALLFLPGFLTDIMGLLLLLPPVQRLLEHKFMPYVTLRFRAGVNMSNGYAGSKQAEGRIIEGEYQRKDDKS